MYVYALIISPIDFRKQSTKLFILATQALFQSKVGSNFDRVGSPAILHSF